MNILAELVPLIASSAPRCGPVRVVAVDGGAASGKSTLAAKLAADLTDKVAADRSADLTDKVAADLSADLSNEVAADLSADLTSVTILSLDDLLDGWAGQFSFSSRLRAQVLEPLAAGQPGRYQRYDWLLARFTDWVTVPVSDVLIIEGVSAIEACQNVLSVGIFLDVPRPVRQHRWVRRDGVLHAEELAWLDAEDHYFAEHPVPTGTLLIKG